MIQLPSDISNKDVAQWLSGGVFFFKNNDGDFVLARLVPFDPYSEVPSNIRIKLLDGDASQITVQNKSDLYAHWPMCGAVNLIHIKLAAFFNRLQVKQYTRTYCARCVDISIPRYTSRRTFRSDDSSVVKSVFYPEYFTYSEALKKFKQDWHSVALSPQLIVVNNDMPQVFYRGRFIGRINKENRLLPINESLSERVMKHFKGEVYV